MDLTVFLIGAVLFGTGFALLLIQLSRKRKLIVPFVVMSVGVLLCFIGLMLASPLTENENKELRYQSYHDCLKIQEKNV